MKNSELQNEDSKSAIFLYTTNELSNANKKNIIAVAEKVIFRNQQPLNSNHCKRGLKIKANFKSLARYLHPTEKVVTVTISITQTHCDSHKIQVGISV